MDRIQIKSLRLNNYRNYDTLDCQFNQHNNVITGLNGAGKTSILDAIYYLSNGKSFHSHIDSYIYRKGTDFLFLRADYMLGDENYTLEVQSSKEKGKLINVDDKAMKSMAEFVGRFPAFMIAPKDILILVESSVERRKLIDKTISQVDKTYFQHLLSYNKLLKQRNAALKEFAKRGRPDHLMLDAFDSKMLEPCAYIHQKRQEYIRSVAPLVNDLYAQISQHVELVELTYKSSLNKTDYATLLKNSRQKDIIMAKTYEGVHRDDLKISLNGMDIRKTGSQGQLKSAIIAMKLAQVEWIKSETGRSPLILLDDVFDKLDKTRVENLIDICANKLNSQIFISDTDSDRVTRCLDELKLDYKHFKIEDGELVS